MNTSKNILFLFLIVSILFFQGCFLRKAPISDTCNSLENTTWSGLDSDGDFYRYTFLPNGQVKYSTNTARTDTVTFEDNNDTWSQNGKKVIIVLGKTSVQISEIKGSKIVRTAWNKENRNWSWTAQKEN